MFFLPANLLKKDLKQDKARKIREETKLLKEQKLKQEKDDAKALQKKLKFLNDLESSYLDELNKRNQKKSELSPEGKRLKAKKRDNKGSLSGNSDSDYKLGRNSANTTNLVYSQSPRKYTDSLAERLIDETRNSLDSYSLLNSNSLANQKRFSIKKRNIQLPQILKNINNGIVAVHIVGDELGKIKTPHSENVTPLRGMDDKYFESHANPTFHMFRDIPHIHRSVNCIPDSKFKIMREYDKKVVKRDFTPKPSLNQKLKIEANKLKSSLKTNMNTEAFLKVFQTSRVFNN
ncbi:hypothetical protein SteCoe_3323 [Stentor coeruleus]|uniref:Uncharacterized protein n=1 Tax=Stentor coeruleus TaxID=5963 RepID=A0A1R2CX85_9CILI|nr:hypothetical protein SteCoe_3323 [Stentor coeruleus]